ncbi:MAG: ATP-binding protein, partial [Armatimonadetes bacterium]|nr:ATP-binding protein [Anaerolineae bacterium]
NDLSLLLKQFITGFQSRSDAEIDLVITGEEWRLPGTVQVSLYRIAQEGLNNVLKHARADHVRVTLVYTPETVALTVADDGRGFDPTRINGECMGVKIMRERADSCKLQFSIHTAPQQGTRLSATGGQPPLANIAVTQESMHVIAPELTETAHQEPTIYG